MYGYFWNADPCMDTCILNVISFFGTLIRIKFIGFFFTVILRYLLDTFCFSFADCHLICGCDLSVI